MPIRCENCPLRKLPFFDDATESEIAFLNRFKTGELTVNPGTPLLMAGSSSPQLFTVLSGQGLRYTTLPDGRRQIINFIFPGDFLGLQAGLWGEMSHSVEATSRMTLCLFNRADVYSLFRNQPSLAYDLTWLAAADEHFLGESLATVGQRSAIERIAWAMVTIQRRAQALGIASDHAVPFPYRQQDLADALGLSLVHTNKTLAKLRERQLASWQDGTLYVNDPETLAEIAQITLSPPRPRPLM